MSRAAAPRPSTTRDREATTCDMRMSHVACMRMCMGMDMYSVAKSDRVRDRDAREWKSTSLVRSWYVERAARERLPTRRVDARALPLALAIVRYAFIHNEKMCTLPFYLVRPRAGERPRVLAFSMSMTIYVHTPQVSARNRKLEKCRGCKEIGERGLETGPETVVCALRVRAKSSFLESDGSSVGVVSHAAVRRSPRKLEHERCRPRVSRAM